MEITQNNQAEEIAKKDINEIGKDALKAQEAICIREETFQSLCELKSYILTTSEELAYEQIQELLNIQEYLAKNAKAENENEVLLVIKSPDGKYYLTKVPRSYRQPQRLNIKINGENIPLEAVPFTNGYNTEYKINDGNGDWRQMAILFTLINPEWRNIDQKIKKIEDEIKLINKKISDLNAKNQKLKKGLSKSGKTKKDKIILDNINKNNKEIKRLNERLKDLFASLPSLKGELAKHQKLKNFPYTPYNFHYDKEEFHSHGFAYLNEGTKKAWEHLGDEKSFVGGEEKLKINEAFPHELALTLNIVERMDFAIYFQDTTKKNPKPKEEIEKIMDSQIQKALTTVAINQKGAFNWQRSGVGALGIGQFMPNTYNNIVKEYPRVFPENLSFEEGAKNHDISFRMQAIHFHEETRRIPKWIRDNWQEIIKDEEAKLGLYAIISAGYNGSISRIIRETEIGVEHLLSEFENEIKAEITKIEALNKKRKQKIKVNLKEIVNQLIKNGKFKKLQEKGIDIGSFKKKLEDLKLLNDNNENLRNIRIILRDLYNNENTRGNFFKEDINKLHPDALLRKLGTVKETETYVMKFLYTRDYLRRNYRDFGETN